MADAELNIVLRLLDEATDGIKKAMGETGDEAQKAGDKAEKSNKAWDQGLKNVSKTVRSFRRELFAITIAVGFFALATKEWAKTNTEARNSVDEIGRAWSNFLTLVGSSGVGTFFGNIAKKFNEHFVGDLNDTLQQAQSILKNFADDQKNNQTLFQSGQMGGTDFFKSVILDQQSVIAQNQNITASIQELAALSVQLGDEQLALDRVRMDEQIGLLHEYEENFRIAHSGMTALVTTLSQNIRTNLSSALTGIITGATTAKEAFAQLGKQLIEVVVNFMVQKLIAFALEKTLLAGSVAAATVAGAQILSAYGPAAVAANIATFGAAGLAAAGSAAIAGAAHIAAFSAAGITPQAIAGGGTGGGGGGGFAEGTPQVPFDMFTKVHKNEMIVPATFAEGIRKGDVALGGGSGVTVNVYYPNMTNGSDIEGLAEDLGFRIERQLRYAR